MNKITEGILALLTIIAIITLLISPLIAWMLVWILVDPVTVFEKIATILVATIIAVITSYGTIVAIVVICR